VQIFFEPLYLVPGFPANQACRLRDNRTSRKRARGHHLASKQSDQISAFIYEAASAVGDRRARLGFECLEECGKAARQEQIVRIHPTDVGCPAPCNRLIDTCGLTLVRRASPPRKPVLPARDHPRCVVGGAAIRQHDLHRNRLREDRTQRRVQKAALIKGGYRDSNNRLASWSGEIEAIEDPHAPPLA